ncbi:MAG: pyruvate kinase, partial [Betaproteobacteria bacterium]|nr:pyruvate kinase [Betaproteobacteria bacterium]
MKESSSYHLTKILVTIGPASNSVDKIQALIDAGANCFRLNFSHGTQEEHRKVYENIRQCEEKSNYPVGVIADLQGPKLRIAGMPEGGSRIASGDRITLKLGSKTGDGKTCFLPHPEIFAAVQSQSILLVDDGRIRLQVIECSDQQLQAQVLVGGVLKSNKGVNLPGAMLPLSAITERDEENLRFALDLGVDWVALSFVQSPEDLEKARKLIDGRAKLIAKIEKPLAVEKIDDIVDASDGIMIARGDLGVEVDAAEVPALQKRLIRLCRIKSRPVIVATQMLESMTASPTPTRAEASDVATAVYEGADAVILSAE